MEFYLTQEQIDEIRALRDAGTNEQGNYSHIYSYIGDLLEQNDAPVELVTWFRGAEQANAGQGAYSAMIRAYSLRQMELRGIGDLYTPELMQRASNEVALRALQDILGENPNTSENRLQPDGTWKFPSIADIAINDATGVGQILFGTLANEDTARAEVANAAWSGTVLFSALNSDQAWRLTSAGGSGMDVVDDLKNILFAYDALSAGLEAAIVESAFNGVQFWFTDVPIGWDTLVNSPDETLAIARENLTKLLPTSAQELGRYVEEVGAGNVLAWIASSLSGHVVLPADDFKSQALTVFGSMTPEDLKGFAVKVLPNDQAEIFEQAKSDESVRNALIALSPIAIEQTTYNNDVSLYDGKTGAGALTESYLADRAYLLTQLITLKNFDASIVPVSQEIHEHYQDLASGINVATSVFAAANPSSVVNYIFGGDAVDSIVGGIHGDRLYGGAGEDAINGGNGDDYIEGNSGDDIIIGGQGIDTVRGGAGFDTYVYSAGDGTDVIEDADGKIIYGAVELTGGALVGNNTYVSADGAVS